MKSQSACIYHKIREEILVSFDKQLDILVNKYISL